MKEKYEAPKVEVSIFEANDIITMSNNCSVMGNPTDVGYCKKGDAIIDLE